ncbi:biotin--[acetyl-CoA-carboxylase] ligase [Psittacicella hinzii]|nr:hypothetical protein [Psittacicella hinzii]
MNSIYLNLTQKALSSQSFDNAEQALQQTLLETSNDRTSILQLVEHLASDKIFAKYIDLKNDVANFVQYFETNLQLFKEYAKSLVYIDVNEQYLADAINNINLYTQSSSTEAATVYNFYNLHLDREIFNLAQPYIFTDNKLYPTKLILDNTTIQEYSKNKAKVNCYLLEQTESYLLSLFLFSIDSTNKLAEQLLNKWQNNEKLIINLNTFCQTAGAGRSNKKWLSSMYADITNTIVIPDSFVSKDVAKVISLQTANAIHHTIYNYLTQEHSLFEDTNNNAKSNANTCLSEKPQLHIKWPNDIYFNNKKLSGILITKAKQHYIIGYGVNLLAKNKYQLQYIDQPVTALHNEQVTQKLPLVKYFSLNTSLVDSINIAIVNYLLVQQSFAKDYYQAFNYFSSGDKLIVNNDINNLQTFSHVDENGYLYLIDQHNNLQTHIVPNISIKKA